jgi:hypothetical protein
MIKNLTQLKKVIKDGTKIIICDYRDKKNISETTIVRGYNFAEFYVDETSNIKPEDVRGRYFTIPWQMASMWKFNNGLCKLYLGDKDNKYLFISFIVLD